MSLGQMSEIFFMLLIPFFFRKLGVKWMILIGMLCWVARYLLFSFGAPDHVAWMLFAAIILHGICYDFFFVTGFMYTEQKAPKEIRGQAQSMLVFFTQGLGMWIGYKIAFGVWQMPGQKVGSVSTTADLDTAITGIRGEETLTYLEKLKKMFSVNMPEKAGVDGEMASLKAGKIEELSAEISTNPEGLDAEGIEALESTLSGLRADPHTVSHTMEQWKDLWMFPALMALAISILFFVAFWDKTTVGHEEK